MGMCKGLLPKRLTNTTVTALSRKQVDENTCICTVPESPTEKTGHK